MHFCDIVNNKEGWWIMERFQRVVMKFISPQGNLFRYSLSFCVLLALLPALIIFLKVFQTDILSAPNLINLLYDYVPETILAPFVEYVMSQEYTTFVSLIISMGFSIYFTSACIVLIGVFFFYIVNHYTRYNALYGPLASLVIMLISIYLISSVIYFGYCLNHEYGKSFSRRTYKHQKFYDYGNNFLDKIVEKFGKLI